MANYLTLLAAVGGSGLLALVSGCTPLEAPPQASGPITEVAGWYLQNPAAATLQPCARPERFIILEGSELRRRAKAFDLQDDLPIYVRVKGMRDKGAFRLVSVEQFGSPEVIRDCPMTGTTVQ